MTTTKHVLIDASGVKEIFNDKIPQHYNVLKSPIIIDDRIDNTAFVFEIVRTNSETQFHFLHLENKVFANNLIIVDSVFPKILSHYLLLNYQTGVSAIKQLTELVAIADPINYCFSNQNIYSYKIRFFLTELVFGMKPSDVWKGEYRGPGFIINISNKEKVCFHLFDKNNFEEFIYNHTYISTTNIIYEDMGKQYLKLNLQIRFK